MFSANGKQKSPMVNYVPIGTIPITNLLIMPNPILPREPRTS